tara:strand:+ start:169 stop:843 length:675 start_codon:yes stop_codon:yes gene_type:complete
MKKIIWTTSIQELSDTPELHIKNTREVIPSWFKKIKIHEGKNFLDKIKTVKTCPSFAEIFNEGFVMLSPVDIYINVKENYYEWRIPSPLFRLEEHPKEQFLKFANIPNASYVSKFISSWNCITPKGYSLRQMPMFYEEQPDFYVPYGVVKTDYSHEINPQLIFNGDKKEIHIKQGQPLAIYVPYKRKDKLNLSIEDYSIHNRKIKQSSFYTSGSTFRSNYHKYN